MTRDLTLIVFGGRDFYDEPFLFECLDFLHRTRNVVKVIEGGATGADELARKWAKVRGIPCETVEADWYYLGAPGAVVRQRRDGSFYNAKAGPDRNAKMLTMGASTAVGFEGGDGTADMARQARSAGVPVWEPRR